jgi:hypothetical protein
MRRYQLSYQYAKGDLLLSPQDYQYSQYQGQTLIDNWQASRQALLVKLPQAMPLPITVIEYKTNSGFDTHALLSKLCLAYREQNESEFTQYWLPVFIKKFEVSKRLFSLYQFDAPHRKQTDDYRNLQPYLYLAECLIHQWTLTPKSYLLSCLLKLSDTLATQVGNMTTEQAQQLAWIVEQELRIVNPYTVKGE